MPTKRTRPRLTSTARVGRVATAFLIVPLLSCDRPPAEAPTAGTLGLHVIADASASSVDLGIIHVEGPANRRVEVQPGETRTIDGLPPGVYTVAIEALSAGSVTSFGQTGGVHVVAGSNTTVTVALQTFSPAISIEETDPEVGADVRITWGAVAGASQYDVEFSETADFGQVNRTRVQATVYTWRPSEPGPQYVRVRAVSRFGNVGEPGSAVAVNVLPFGLTGIWTGTYAWDCDDPGDGSRSGSTAVRLDIADNGTARLTGTVTYFGATAAVSGERLRDAVYDPFGITEGTSDPDGMDVRLSWNATAAFANNAFSGAFRGDSLAGTTLNGDTGEGCSALSRAAGTLSLRRE